MPRAMTRREKVSDWLYMALLFGSRLLFVITGIIGYFVFSIIGSVIGASAGLAVGFWMHYSMGFRGPNPIVGFYIRMRERANGSRQGFLEFVLETLSGNAFTRVKCQKIADAYDSAQLRFRNCKTEAERNEIFWELDRATKYAFYD